LPFDFDYVLHIVNFIILYVIYPLTDFAQFHGTLFGFHPTDLSQFPLFPSDFQLFSTCASLKRLENVHLVHQIWKVLVLHFNHWVETSAGGLIVFEGLYSPVAMYFGTCI
jgi:hypothetical protein